MNRRNVTMIAIVLSFGLFALDESALAQEERGMAHSRDFNCHTIKAEAHDTWPGAGNVSTGVALGSSTERHTTPMIRTPSRLRTLTWSRSVRD
jgi:hypothetical protein